MLAGRADPAFERGDTGPKLADLLLQARQPVGEGARRILGHAGESAGR